MNEWPEGFLFLTKKDYVIIAGDFGVIWDRVSTEREQLLLNFYENCPWTTLFLPGNHENYERLYSDEFPTQLYNGGKARQISPSIWMLEHGHIFALDGRNIFTFGGAHSTDQLCRIEHVSWWKEEIPSYTKCKTGLERLQAFFKLGGTVDAIITHTCPESIKKNQTFLSVVTPILQRSISEEKTLNVFLDLVLNTVIRERVEKKKSIPLWFFGHWHIDCDFHHKGLSFHCMYERKPLPVSTLSRY